jgi:class 3 adenylate cyclase
MPPGLTPVERHEYFNIILVTMSAIGICSAYFLLYLAWDHPLAKTGLINDFVAIVSLLCLFIWLKLKKILTAVFHLVATSFLVLSNSAMNFGTQMSVHHYLPVVAGGILLLHPKRRRWIAGIYGVLGLMVYIYLEVNLPERSNIGPPISKAMTDLSTILALSISYMAVMGYVFWTIIQKEDQDAQIERERMRSDSLLLNILPNSIAQRLLNSEEQIADGFESVTVLFADIVNFTELSQTLPPHDLVAYLNQVFSKFDTLTFNNGLEKIKTIGDAYMVAGGIPEPREDHAEAVLRLGLAMLEYAENSVGPSGNPLELRIGIHTGPVIAGVIGIKKFIYDLWGDTVNLASRLEMQGFNNTIQISDTTYQLVKDILPFEERGMIDLKGRGPTQTWVYRLPSRLIHLNASKPTKLKSPAGF